LEVDLAGAGATDRLEEVRMVLEIGQPALQPKSEIVDRPGLRSGAGGATGVVGLGRARRTIGGVVGVGLGAEEGHGQVDATGGWRAAAGPRARSEESG